MKRLLPICLVLAAILTGAEPAQLDTDRDGMPDEWEIAFGLDPADPKDASLDPDQDSLPNLDEYRAGTNPTNGQSRLQFTAIRFSGRTSFELQYPGTTGITYRLESSELLIAPVWSNFVTTIDHGGPFFFPTVPTSRYFRIRASRSGTLATTASLNIAGYVVLTALPGTNRLLNPLFSTDHRVSSLVYDPPDGTLVTNDRSESAYYLPYLLGGWDNPNLVLAPGRNFTLVNPTTEGFLLNFIGETLNPVVSATSSGNRMAVRVIGASAASYVLQRSSNLRTWQSLHTNVGPSAFTFDLTGSDLHHYFRALYLP